jgi:Protein kinase domain
MGVLAPGTVLGGCRIDGVVGRGGMGVVYRARQLELDRDVAVKVIAPELVEDPQIRKRFLSEARAAGAVEHPNVVPVHGAGIDEGRAYLVMRYVEGHDLRTVVLAEGPLTTDRATRIAEQLGDALDAIHHLGYVHRDLKPQNVLVDAAGHVYLSDFGLAKQALTTVGDTRSEQWVGTLDYVAPEQIRGERVDARADVYAFGGVLYFMLTRRVPFERASDHAKLWAHLADPPPRPSDARPALPPELDAVVLRALAKDPADRYPSAGDLARSARSAAGHAGTPAPERTVARGAAAPEDPTIASGSRIALRRRRRAPVLAAVALLLASGAAALMLLRGDDGGARDPGPTPTPTPVPAAQPRVTTFEDVARRPRGVVVARGDVWLISSHQGDVARLDAETGDPHGRQQWIGQGATDIARDGKLIWITSRERRAFMALSADTGRMLRYKDLGMPAIRIAAGPTGVWVVGRPAPDGPAVLHRFNGDDLEQPPAEYRFRNGITDIALGGGEVWVASQRVGRVLRVRPGSDAPEHAAWLNEPAAALAYGRGYVWASIQPDDSVARIDPRIEDDVISTANAERPEQIVVTRGRVWTASSTDHSVVAVNPRTTNAVAKVTVPPNPYALAAGRGHIWVTGVGTGTLARIDL